MPPQVTTEILGEYYVHRLKVSSKGEAVCRKHLGEIDLTDTLVAEINAELARRRKRYRKKHGVLPEPTEVVDLELARDVMAALAQDIMLVRAPRSANLVGIRLDWIAFQGSRARITVPAAVVKGREANDPDLPIPLGEQTSRQLRLYIEQIRPLALQSGDELNPFLFPCQDHRSFRPTDRTRAS